MKKMILALAAAVLLLGGTMSVCAYDETLDGVQCYCSVTDKDVMAYTAVGLDTITVIIHSHAYNAGGNAIGSNGNAGGGYTSTRYTASEKVSYAIQEHEVPLYNIKKTLIQYGK